MIEFFFRLVFFGSGGRSTEAPGGEVFAGVIKIELFDRLGSGVAISFTLGLGAGCVVIL